jgi:hypothetical protein
MISARFKDIPTTRWLCAVTALVLGAFGSNWAVAGSEFADDEPPPYVHEHAPWSISICPVLMSMTDLESASSRDATSQLGVAIAFSRRVSQVVLLDFGIQVSESHHTENAIPVLLLRFGPKFMVHAIQRDRFFVGVGGAVLAAGTKGGGGRWGGGPTLTMGLDYAVSHSNCLYLDGTVGLALLTTKHSSVAAPRPDDPRPPDGSIHWDWENGAAWAQLALGLRFPL